MQAFKIERISHYDEAGPGWYWNNFSCGEHTGTHFDAPVHWISGRDHPANSVDTIAPEHFIAPAVVLDASAEVAQNDDWLLTVEFIQDWERRHGRIPPRAWVLLRSDWSRRAQDPAAFLNLREDGAHTPGPTQEAVQWLIRERDAHGFGVETINTDAGQSHAWPLPYPCHTLMHGANRYGLQCLKNLDQLPPQGAMILAALLKIEGGSGSPARAGAGGADERADRNPGGVRRQRHQLLVGAALLAVRGKRVLVLERNDRLGGCIRTEELFPATGTRCSRPGIRCSSAVRAMPNSSPSWSRPGWKCCAATIRPAWSGRTAGAWRSGRTWPTPPGAWTRSPGDGQALRHGRAHVRRGRRADLRPAGQESLQLGSACCCGQRMAQARAGRHDRLAAGALENFRRWSERTLRSDAARALIAPWTLHSGLGPDDAGSALIGKLTFAAVVSGGMPVIKAAAAGWSRRWPASSRIAAASC